MKIGIDGYEANIQSRVGIGQYAYQLLNQLHRLDKENEYTIFLPQSPVADMPHERENWRYIIGHTGIFWTIFQLPSLLKKKQLDLFFSPTHYAPWFTDVPCILSIMDLSYLRYPELFRIKDYLQLKYMGSISIKRAKKILTISEFSKKEIIEHYKYPKDDIVVTYPGFKSNLKSQISKLQPKTRKLTDERYILFVGTIQPRKNIVRLIEAFEKLDDNKTKLVMVGKKGWLFEPILERIKRSPKILSIIYRNFVDNTELTALYANAACFCLPSLYEGFGITVVEALSFGCPVVISNSSSLPEVAGNAGIYVNPLDTSDIARGLKEALQLPGEEKENLVKKGKTHITKFSWEKCARKTLEVIKSFAPS